MKILLKLLMRFRLLDCIRNISVTDFCRIMVVVDAEWVSDCIPIEINFLFASYVLLMHVFNACIQFWASKRSVKSVISFTLFTESLYLAIAINCLPLNSRWL